MIRRENFRALRGGSCLIVAGCALTVFVQFDIPVDVVPPAHRSILDSERQSDNRHPLWFCRSPDKPHACFTRRPATFLVIAGKTCCDDVLPRCFSALHLRDHVVKGEVLRWMLDAAVLAGVFVALVDIRPRETDFLAGTPNLNK